MFARMSVSPHFLFLRLGSGYSQLSINFCSLNFPVKSRPLEFCHWTPQHSAQTLSGESFPLAALCEGNNSICAGPGKNKAVNLQEKHQSAAKLCCARISGSCLCGVKILTSPGILCLFSFYNQEHGKLLLLFFHTSKKMFASGRFLPLACPG